MGRLCSVHEGSSRCNLFANRLLDEHRFRSPGKLVVCNLDWISHVYNIGNYRIHKALQLLAPATISVIGANGVILD